MWIKVQKQVRTFGTTTRELLALRAWLLTQGCTHVAMESTGVYWKPVYAVLEAEGALEIVAIFKMSPFHDEGKRPSWTVLTDCCRWGSVRMRAIDLIGEDVFFQRFLNGLVEADQQLDQAFAFTPLQHG